jgi:hypothetical protein
LEPAFRGTPVVESQNHARVCAGIPNRIREQPLTTYNFMKPTPQISHGRQASFPLTECNYQPTGDAKMSTGRSVGKLTGFHKLSSDFLGTEMVRDYAVEFSVSTLIAALSAWPIILSIQAIAGLLGFK